MNENGISRAEKRVREMNEMAQQYVRQGNNFMNSRNRQQSPQRQPQHIQQPRFEPVHMPKPPAPEPPKPVISNSMQGFGMDTEKLMILLIMYLLIKEKADFKLIAALGYLLL